MYNAYYPQLTHSNQTEEDNSNLMDVTSLASYLNIGRNLAYQLLNDGIIKGFRIGKQWRVSKQAVDVYVAKNSGLM